MYVSHLSYLLVVWWKEIVICNWTLLRGPLIYGRLKEGMWTVDFRLSEQFSTCRNNIFFDKNFSKKKLKRPETFDEKKFERKSLRKKFMSKTKRKILEKKFYNFFFIRKSKQKKKKKKKSAATPRSTPPLLGAIAWIGPRRRRG